MKVTLYSDAAAGLAWDKFVESQPRATNYHRWNWKQVIESSFGWPTYYLAAEEGETIQGILPLVWQKSRLFGSFLTSLPFLNAGGIVAANPEVEHLLLNEGIRIARESRARYLEFRHREEHDLGLPVKTSKITLVLPIVGDSEENWKALSTKMRTKIRKSMSFGLTPVFGGAELLDEFYAIFRENMRDLGTPVYSRYFFEQILRAFPGDTHLCVIRQGSNAVAASFLSGFRDRLEAVWSSSVQKYLALKPNFFLYWNLIIFAGEKGYRLFDFGRSSIGSGTHEFKLQWGAQPVPLYWHYWLAEGNHLPELNPQNPKYRAAIWMWQRLPLSITSALGPRIVRCLP
ncbi:MAG TPA: FemAB family XrtA/PEP-CTERM system-associated protein [Candidatus Acidoferrum sp.]|nr:FemAB family XrtA/PEP-CTERM system-associated protein [Candidatus Acidoferrum sp.]